MDKKLLANALTKFIFGFLLMAALLFLSAGTVCWYGAWLLLAVLFLPMLVLGSGLSFLSFLPYPLLIAKRIENEEAVLDQGLPGCNAYRQKTKYRLVPYLW